MAVHSYLRVSTSGKGQTVENQRLAIQTAGYATDYWYEEEGVSGSVDAVKRPKFADMLSKLQAGDLCVMVALDRLGRNAADILNTTKTLENMGVKVCILNMGSLDITSAFGKAFMQIMAALAELERSQIQERVISGLTRTKAQGTILGRPYTITPQMLTQLCEKKSDGMTLKAMSKEYDLDVMTIQRNIKKWNGRLFEYTELYHKQQEQIDGNKAA